MSENNFNSSSNTSSNDTQNVSATPASNTTTQTRYTASHNDLDIINEYACFGQLNILSLRRIFLLLMRNFFSNPTNFNVSIEPDWIQNFDQYTYSDPVVDPNKEHPANIDIRLSYQYADNASKIEYLKEGQKPQIIINIGDFVYESFGVLDNFTSISNRQKGELVRGINVTCDITISCFGRSYADAVILSQLSSSFLIGMREMLIRKLRLKDLVPVVLKAPICTSPDKALKTYQADFVLKIVFESNYKSSIESMIIRSIKVIPNTYDI